MEAPNKWVVLGLAATGAFMTALDGSIVNVALPSIAHTFHVPLGGAVEWIIIAYLVVIAGLLLSAGRLADGLGRKPLFIGGIAIFTLGSVLCGAAPSLGLLIAARGLQGIGAAALYAVNLAMVSTAFPARQRGLALGINLVIVSLGVSVGPTIGGLIVQGLSWHWIFYINVPLGIVVMILANWLLVNDAPQGPSGKFDLLGAALLGGGLALLTLDLSFGQEWGWGSPKFVLLLGLATVALGMAFRVEQRTPTPILDLNLLRRWTFSAPLLSFMFCQLALFAVGFLMPFYLQELRGYDAAHAGLILTPFALMLAVCAPLSGSLADRFGSRWLAPIGLGIASLGLLLLCQLNAHSSTWDIIWRLMCIGVGQGIFTSPNSSTLMNAAPEREQGAASGLLSQGRVIAQSMSIALAGAVFATLGGAAAGSTLATHATSLKGAQLVHLQATFINGFRGALVACALFAALGLLTAIVPRSAVAAPTMGTVKTKPNIS